MFRHFDIGDPSPHSYYPCVIGCGDENYTPDKESYNTPNQLDDRGRPESPLRQYYQDNFIVIEDDGSERMTLDLDLLPESMRQPIKENNGSK